MRLPNAERHHRPTRYSARSRCDRQTFLQHRRVQTTGMGAGATNAFTNLAFLGRHALLPGGHTAQGARFVLEPVNYLHRHDHITEPTPGARRFAECLAPLCSVRPHRIVMSLNNGGLRPSGNSAWQYRVGFSIQSGSTVPNARVLCPTFFSSGYVNGTDHRRAARDVSGHDQVSGLSQGPIPLHLVKLKRPRRHGPSRRLPSTPATARRTPIHRAPSERIAS